MIKKTLATMLLSSFAAAAGARQVWTLWKNKAGRLAVPAQGRGRYILTSGHDHPGEVDIAGKKVQHVSYATTLSFVAR